MLPFAYYLLKITICSAVFFGYYWFALRNKVFHGYNRFYLLAIIGFSLILPLCSIHIFQEKHAPQTSVIKMLQVVTASDEYIDEVVIALPQKSSFSFIEMLPLLYLVVSIILFVMLIQMLFSIFVLWKKSEPIKIEQIHFINTDAGKGTPFSFFKYIFWNKQIDMDSPAGNRIFKHELAHIQEHHSWDKMFINLVLIAFWINPIFWLIRRELSMIHEFIADKRAVEDGDTEAFACMILAATYPQHQNIITNNFFYSPIKRRLMMLTKNKHPRVNYISRLLVLPLLIVVFAAFTIKAKEYKDKQTNLNNWISILEEKNATKTDIQTPKLDNTKIEQSDAKLKNILTQKQITVVLDAGHGGTDPGAKSLNGIYEKDMTLQLVKKIKALNKNMNINLILTRETDLTQTVQEKADFVKKSNADLFISIHMDYQFKFKGKKNINIDGLSVYISNDSIANNEKSKLFASAVIGSFKNNYGLDVKPSPLQKKMGIWVLKANNIPSVLLEAGCINTNKDLEYLQSADGQETFANNVLNAINSFANNIKENNVPKQEAQKRIAQLIKSDDQLGKIDASQREEYKNGKSSIRFTIADSNDIAYLFKGLIISKKVAMEKIAKDSVDIYVYDANTGLENFGIKTVKGIINIIEKTEENKNLDPVFRIGNLTSNRIKADEFKKQKLATVTDNYEFVSCNVYFGGTGFPKAEAANLNGNDFTKLNAFLERCAAGTSIAFTNIRVKNKDGMRSIEEKVYTLY